LAVIDLAEMATHIPAEKARFFDSMIDYASDDMYSAVDYDQLIAAVRDEATQYLEKKAAEVKKLGVEKVSVVAKEGFAADEIIALGRKNSDSLIAMCSHGRTGVKRWVLGSVTEAVVRHSGDPVLVMRAK
jgi:nucleotide-binding universal stress UspA family protein